MRRLLDAEGLADRISIDSAGTGAWHVGESPDGRARAAGSRHGLDVHGRARAFVASDFERFDYVLAMDRSNRSDLLRLARNDDERRKVRLFRNFDATGPREADVPDPYYGGEDGFDDVIDICEAACRGLLSYIRRHHDL